VILPCRPKRKTAIFMHPFYLQSIDIMTNTDRPAGRIHHGRNIKRFREMFGIKQEALALELGDDWSQKKVSRLEENERVEEEVLEQVAKILKVPVEAIKNFDEEAAIVYFNTFGDHSFSNGAFNANYCTFNPIDKIVELYEALLKSEKEKVEILREYSK
jgi:transcriptional regulator with XRE-family HTH domain